MKHRGNGNFGVEFHQRDKGDFTQWFTSEKMRKEAYHNYCRDPKFSKVRMVEK